MLLLFFEECETEISRFEVEISIATLFPGYYRLTRFPPPRYYARRHFRRYARFDCRKI